MNPQAANGQASLATEGRLAADSRAEASVRADPRGSGQPQGRVRPSSRATPACVAMPPRFEFLQRIRSIEDWNASKCTAQIVLHKSAKRWGVGCVSLLPCPERSVMRDHTT